MLCTRGDIAVNCSSLVSSTRHGLLYMYFKFVQVSVCGLDSRLYDCSFWYMYICTLHKALYCNGKPPMDHIGVHTSGVKPGWCILTVFKHVLACYRWLRVCELRACRGKGVCFIYEGTLCLLHILHCSCYARHCRVSLRRYTWQEWSSECASVTIMVREIIRPADRTTYNQQYTLGLSVTRPRLISNTR